MTKVLIVDDEETIRFSFSSILRDEGYDVICAEHPIDVRSIMNANTIDVAVIDRLLVNENGMDIVKFINEKQPCCTTILMSAYPNFKSAAEGFKHNLFAYLQKPVKKEELCRIVKKASVRRLEKQRKNHYAPELIKLQRMSTMDQLSGGIIHDYNNILMPVMGLAQLACLELPPDHNLTGQLEKLISATKQMQGLPKLLLSYFQSDDSTFEVTTVQTLFENALAILRIILSKSIIIEEKIIGGGRPIHVNAAQIQQVVINLGMNAITAMGESNKILKMIVETVQPDSSIREKMNSDNRDCIKVVIGDHRYDKKEAFSGQPFTPFFSTDQYPEETDLGLSVSFDIINTHGGVIVVNNLYRPDGTFDVYLPLAEL